MFVAFVVYTARRATEATVAGQTTNNGDQQNMDMTPRPKREIIIPSAGDGMLLRGTLYRPEEDPGDVRGVITIHGSTGRSEKSYELMARHLANRGYAVITYCRRGMERSGMKSDTRNQDITAMDWISDDAPGILEWAREHFPGQPAYAIGHGIGGLGVLYSGAEGLYDGAVLLGVGTRGLRAVDGILNKAKLFGLLTFVCPVTAETMDHIPTGPFGFEVEPPVGVVRQWARWARRRDYFFGDKDRDFDAAFACANSRYLSVRFDGDEWCNEAGADEITDRLFSAEVEKLVVSKESVPGPAGEGPGHNGILAGGNEPSWNRFADWLEACQ